MKTRMTVVTGLILALLIAGIALAASVTVPSTRITIEPLTGWDVDTSGTGGALLVIKDAKPLDGFPVMIKLIADDLEGKTPDLWLAQYKAELKGQMKDFRMHKDGPLKLGGVEYQVLEFSGLQGKAMLYYLQAIRIQEGKAWIFTGICLSRRSDIYAPKFKKMLQSIYFPPPPPADFAVVGSTPTTIQLVWKDMSSDETAFIVQRRLATDQAWVDAAQVPANIVNYTDQNLTCNTEYKYRVKTANPRGDSNWSAEIGAKTAECVEIPPPPPGTPPPAPE